MHPVRASTRASGAPDGGITTANGLDGRIAADAPRGYCNAAGVQVRFICLLHPPLWWIRPAQRCAGLFLCGAGKAHRRCRGGRPKKERRRAHIARDASGEWPPRRSEPGERSRAGRPNLPGWSFRSPPPGQVCPWLIPSRHLCRPTCGSPCHRTAARAAACRSPRRSRWPAPGRTAAHPVRRHRSRGPRTDVRRYGCARSPDTG